MVWFQCSVCSILLPTKFRIWSHLLKTHGVYCTSDDVKNCWTLVELIPEDDLKIKVAKTTEEEIDLATTRTTTATDDDKDNDEFDVAAENFCLKGDGTIHVSVNDTSDPNVWKYQCVPCKLKFRLMLYLQRHRWKFHRQKKPDHFCDQCDKTFKVRTLLEYHKLTHDPEWESLPKAEQNRRKQAKRTEVMETRMRVCPFPGCGRKFEYETYWLTHVRTHTKEKPFECSTCKTTYSSSFTLQQHLREKKCQKVFNEAFNRPFQCQICKVCLKTRKGLHNHQKRQHNIRIPRSRATPASLKCLFCEYVAGTPSNLAHHNIIHTGEKPFKCPAIGCEAAFAVKHNCTSHVRFHCSRAREQGLDKVYDEEALARKISLQARQYRPKDYKCSQCPQTFTTNARLKIHESKHGSTYKCDFCGCGFLHIRCLSDHKGRVHKDKQKGPQCLLCGRKCNHFTALRRHYQVVHHQILPPMRSKHINEEPVITHSGAALSTDPDPLQ